MLFRSKEEALTPIPSARASTITAVVPGLLRIRRSASWRSRSRLFTTVGMQHVRGQTGSLWNQGPTPVSAVQLTVSGKLRPPEQQPCRRIRLCYRLSATTPPRPFRRSGRCAARQGDFLTPERSSNPHLKKAIVPTSGAPAFSFLRVQKPTAPVCPVARENTSDIAP